RLLKVRARQVIVCTGSRQRPFVFPNNDLPGIFLGNGILRLARLYGVSAGRRAVVMTDNADGHGLASQLTGIGIEVAAVVDLRPAPARSPEGQQGWPVLASHTLVAAHGGSHLKAVRVTRVDERSSALDGSLQEIPCDLLCMASTPVPANELLLQGGLRFRWGRGRWRSEKSVPGLAGAGAAAGTFDLTTQILEGRLRGAEAAAALGRPAPDLADSQRRWESLNNTPAPPSGCLLPAGGGGPRQAFLCLCGEGARKDLERAVAEGFAHARTRTRYAA